MSAFVWALLLPLLAQAEPWMDLENGDSLRLRQEVDLGGRIAFAPGTTLSLLAKDPLSAPGAPLMVYRLEQYPCRQPGWQAPLTIVVPEGAEESQAVGVELFPGCEWHVYVEAKDLLSPSLFDKI